MILEAPHQFTADALGPAPLDGLIQTSVLSAFVADEGLGLGDLNGDLAYAGSVLIVHDRETGAPQTLEDRGGCRSPTLQGRNVIRVQSRPFAFRAVAVEGNTVAFLEPEAVGRLQCDDNRDGDYLDAILRVFQLTPGAGTHELTGQLESPPAADPAPVINGRSLAVSEGLVFFRESEGDNRMEKAIRVSVDSEGVGGNGASSNPTLSGDGHHVAFVSEASNLDDLGPGVFVRDIPDLGQPEQGTTERVSVDVDYD